MGPVLLSGVFCLLLATSAVFCSPSCSTEENVSKGMKETSCVQMSLTFIPMKEIPPDTAILNLSYNALQSVSTSTFKGMKMLVELDVADNSITSFKVDLPIGLQELNLARNSLTKFPELSQLTTLTKLYLTGNQISSIPDSAFKGLKELTFLDLKKNKIDSLDEKIFDGLANLGHLDLSHNQLWQLPDHLISSLTHLEKFYLTGNRLTHIPDNFFENLNLHYVYLDHNPWNCNCALVNFKEWVDTNDFNIYKLVDELPLNDAQSVLCSDGTPLVDFDLDHCSGDANGDADKNVIPTRPTPQKIMPTTATEAPITPKELTTPIMTSTELETTTTEALTTPKELTTPIMTLIEQLEFTTPEALATPMEELTTPIMPSTELETATTEALTTPKEELTTPIMASTELETTTTEALTTPKTKLTTPIMTTTQPETPTTEAPTTKTTEVPTTTTIFHSTSTPSLLPQTELLTLQATTLGSTQKPPITIQDNSSFAIPPAISSRAEAHGMSWLEYEILKNCCFLHFIIYNVCILILLVQMIVAVFLLVWTYTRFFWHYQALQEKVPSIRLIRYSLRAPLSEEQILLVQNGAIEPHLRDLSSSFGVTRMLVLEADSMVEERRYTSAIL